MFDPIKSLGTHETTLSRSSDNSTSDKVDLSPLSAAHDSLDAFDDCFLLRRGEIVAVSIPISVYLAWNEELRKIVDESAFGHFGFDDGALTLTYSSDAWESVVDLSRIALRGGLSVGDSSPRSEDEPDVLGVNRRLPHPLSGPRMIGPFLIDDDDENCADVLNDLGGDDDQADDDHGGTNG